MKDGKLARQVLKVTIELLWGRESRVMAKIMHEIEPV